MVCQHCGCQTHEVVKVRQKRQAKPGDKRSQRGALCRKVMQEQGLTSITEASKFIKDHNLYALYASEASKAAQ
jgi:hypothetical protein